MIDSVFDIIIYGLQIVVFQLIGSPMLSTLSYKQSLAKNKDWVQENPGFLVEYPAPITAQNKVLGAILLTLIAYGAFVNNATFYKIAHIGSLVIFLLQHFVIDTLRHRKITKQIPAPTTRKAELFPRNLNGYIPNLAIYTVFALMFLSIVGWVYWFVNGAMEVNEIRRIVFLLVTTYGLGIGSVFYCVKRKPVKADLNTTHFYRQSEVLVTFVILVSFIALSLVLLAAHIFTIEVLLDSKKWVSYVFTLIPVGFFIWFLAQPQFQKMASENFMKNQ